MDKTKQEEAKNIIDDVLKEHFDDGVDEKKSQETREIRTANNYLKIYDQIKRETSGNIVSITDGFASSSLLCNKDMAVDGKALIHNGFIFNAASFCAAAAINESKLLKVDWLIM